MATSDSGTLKILRLKEPSLCNTCSFDTFSHDHVRRAPICVASVGVYAPVCLPLDLLNVPLQV